MRAVAVPSELATSYATWLDDRDERMTLSDDQVAAKDQWDTATLVRVSRKAVILDREMQHLAKVLGFSVCDT